MVPAVGFVLDEKLPVVELLPKPVVELALLPATEPHGCPLRSVLPDIEGVFIPVLGLVVPGVAECPDPLLVLEPALPPLVPPPLPLCAKVVASPAIISAATRMGSMIAFRFIASSPV